MQNGNSSIIGQEYYCSNGERNRERKKKKHDKSEKWMQRNAFSLL